MAAFTTSKYQSDQGNVHPIRLQPDTLAAAGPVPAGAVSVSITADVKKSKKKFGLGPRGVNCSRILGTAPNTFKKYVFIPVLTKTAWGTTPFIKDGSITYKGSTYTVESLVPEYST